MNCKKPAFWMIVVSAAACIVVTACLLIHFIGDASDPSSGSTVEIDALREQYPEYFDLSIDNGLEIYVWQMASESYSFGILPGTDREKTLEELWGMKGVSAEEMKMILSTYEIDEGSVRVYPWQNPISSYIAEYYIVFEGEEQSSFNARQQAYLENIRNMIFG